MSDQACVHDWPHRIKKLDVSVIIHAAPLEMLLVFSFFLKLIVLISTK